MNCEIIAVGDEVLTGDIVNTNAREIAAGLEDAGVRVRRQTVTSDNPAEIRQTLAEAFDRSDVILTIGGLGPTYDDITRESAAKQMGVPLVRDPETERRIREYFTATGRELTDNNWRQAMIPEGGEALVNLNGTAPGIWLEKDGKILVQLPARPGNACPSSGNRYCPGCVSAPVRSG
ncbi:MAG: competence/damage-inducible protein A [Acutalibacteraceae bacterium]